VSGDRRNHKPTIPTDIEIRSERCEVVRGLRRTTVVAPGREAGRFTSRVDTPHLHRDRGEAGNAHRQNNHKRSDRKCRLDCRSAALTGQTLVLSARLMMFVKAVTIESPVTTV
jgi:hypothetical protein